MTKKTAMLLILAMLIVPAAALADDAAAIYKSKCAICHGPDGSGQTAVGKSLKVRDLRSAEVQKQTDAELEKIISDGREKMPPFKGKITEGDIDNLVKWIRSIKAK